MTCWVLLLCAALQGVQLCDALGLPNDPLGRILNGELTAISAVPYQVSLELPGDKFVCGGSIIGPNWVLTAAHCLPGNLNESMLSVRAGTDRRGAGGSVHAVVNGQRHPSYQPGGKDWDVGVLEVSPAFILDTSRAVVVLPDESGAADHQGRLRAGHPVLVSGWGVLNEDSSQMPVALRKVTLKIVNRVVCRALYVRLVAITDRMICAGSLTGRDACAGDSGGPMVATDPMTGSSVQYGIVSFGKGCGHFHHPGVFTNVADKGVRQYIKTISGV